MFFPLINFHLNWNSKILPKKNAGFEDFYLESEDFYNAHNNGTSWMYPLRDFYSFRDALRSPGGSVKKYTVHNYATFDKGRTAKVQGTKLSNIKTRYCK